MSVGVSGVRTTGFDWVWMGLRAIMAGTIVAAVVAQGSVSIGGAEDRGQDPATVATNFFSYFTVLSNVLAALVLLVVVVWFLARGRTESQPPAALAVALASVTTYMIITGVVYNLLLRGISLEPGLTVSWSNEVLHLIGPIFLALDAVVGARPRRLRWASALAVLGFPVVWLTYTLIRGPLVTSPVTGNPWWYPYPFLDPNNPGGWTSVVLYIGAILVAGILVAALVVAITRWRVPAVEPSRP